MGEFNTRASRIAERKNSGITIADEPLTIDLVPPIQGSHWTVYQLCATGFFAVRQPVANPLTSVGVYVVPMTAPIESLADAQNATFGENTQARGGIVLPYSMNVTRAGAGGQWKFTCYAQLFQELVIPSGWMLRFIANCVPGTPTPGPGANSQGTLTAHVIEESNVPAARTRGV